MKTEIIGIDPIEIIKEVDNVEWVLEETPRLDGSWHGYIAIPDGCIEVQFDYIPEQSDIDLKYQNYLDSLIPSEPVELTQEQLKQLAEQKQMELDDIQSQIEYTDEELQGLADIQQAKLESIMMQIDTKIRLIDPIDTI